MLCKTLKRARTNIKSLIYDSCLLGFNLFYKPPCRRDNTNQKVAKLRTNLLFIQVKQITA